MANRRPPRPDQRGHGPNRRPNAGRPPRQNQNQGQGPSSASRPEKQRQDAPAGEERLQKILAHAGIGSRRACEDVIRQGRVTIDGKVVKELGTKIDSHKAKIAVDGQAIHLERMVYYAVSKPKGYVSTNNDPAGRPRVVDLLPELPQRVYTVGRLDEMSTGLILLTNDGELANKLAHPKYGVEKLYRVIVAGNPERDVLDKLVEGVWLAEGKVRARRVRVVGKKGQATVLEMVLAEGKNREVRRMLAKLGHKVMSLTRIAVGPITLKGLAFGEHRSLSQNEVEMLHRVASGQVLSPTRFSGRKLPQSSDRGRPSGPGEPRRDSADSSRRPNTNAGGPSARPPRRDQQNDDSDGPRRPTGSGFVPGPRGITGGPRRPGQGRPEQGSGYSQGPRRPDSAGGGYSQGPRGDGGGARRPSGPGRSEYGGGYSQGPRGDGGGGARRPSTGRPEYGGSQSSRPPRPEGLPPSQRRPGQGRPDSGPSGSRSPRPEGLPPSQRRTESSGRPAYGSSSGSRPPRPEGLPPSQRRPGAGRPTSGGSSSSGPRPGSGPRPPRPGGGGPASSSRRPTGGGAGPRKPGRAKPPSGEPPQRRIIGMESASPREGQGPPPPRLKPHVIKRRPPRSALPPRQPRRKPGGDE